MEIFLCSLILSKHIFTPAKKIKLWKAASFRFFKEIKPAFCCQWIYHLSLYRFELRKPPGSDIEKKKYLLKALQGLNGYFQKNLGFYEYHRSGANYLDAQYFLRGKTDLDINLNSFSSFADANFSTSHDYTISKILANEMLGEYFSRMLGQLMHEENTVAPSMNYSSDLTWTATKAGLIEIIYALYADGSINNGNADIKAIADHVQRAFNIDLGNYYRTFQEIRIRKKGRTHYLDQLREKLIMRMDNADENPR